jgi:hypothetical protein
LDPPFDPDCPRPKFVLFHATRACNVPSFQQNGISPQYDRRGESSPTGAFYLTNSLANAVAHVLSYQHQPLVHGAMRHIVVFVFLLEHSRIFESTSLKTRHIQGENQTLFSEVCCGYKSRLFLFLIMVTVCGNKF